MGHSGEVRLFMSVDLVGSTAFKGSYKRSDGTKESGLRAAAEPPVGPAWANVFRNFYDFQRYFERKYQDKTLETRLHPKIVKAIGDELLLQVPIKNHNDARDVVSHFAHAMKDYRNINLKQHGLHLKGAAWIAGFPNTNHIVSIDAAKGLQEDFIGPSIDTGFRVSKFATPSKLAVTVDLALLLVHDGHFRLHCDGFESLKGVLGGRPYPILWHEVPADERTSRLNHLARTITGRPSAELNDIKEYCAKFIAEAQEDREWLCRPYFQEEDDEAFNIVPADHKAQYERDLQIDKRNEDEGTDPEAGARTEVPLPDVPIRMVREAVKLAKLRPRTPVKVAKAPKLKRPPYQGKKRAKKRRGSG